MNYVYLTCCNPPPMVGLLFLLVLSCFFALSFFLAFFLTHHASLTLPHTHPALSHPQSFTRALGHLM